MKSFFIIIISILLYGGLHSVLASHTLNKHAAHLLGLPVFLQADLPNLPINWQSTVQHGWLHICSDGIQMWIESQR